MSYDAWKLATPPGYDYQPECSACDDSGCPECCETQPVTLDDLDDLEAQMSQPTIEQLKAVEQAARRLMREGLRLTPTGLIVRESRDNSDPHYQLCKALDAIEPLNPPALTATECENPNRRAIADAIRDVADAAEATALSATDH